MVEMKQIIYSDMSSYQCYNSNNSVIYESYQYLVYQYW